MGEKKLGSTTFSVCMIARDEEKNIGRCLQKLSCLKAEVVVVDTGSVDATREIALKYTKHVYDYTWQDDFAGAKNFAIQKASNEFVMIVDADEFLEPIEGQKLSLLCREMKEKRAAVGRVCRKNVFERDGIMRENKEWINRIFSRERFCYEGRIHEQVISIVGGVYETYLTDLVFIHTGYDLPEEERKEKAMRNIRLLEQEFARLQADSGAEVGGAEEIPYILYQLGKSYYMAQEYVKACDYFSKGLSYDLNPKLEYVTDMVETYGYALLNSGQAEAALFFEKIYDEFGDSADFQFLMGLIYMNNARFETAVEEFLKAVQHEECRSRGVNSYAAYYNIGVIYECLERREEAGAYYEKCGEYEPAKKRLRSMTDMRD